MRIDEGRRRRVTPAGNLDPTTRIFGARLDEDAKIAVTTVTVPCAGIQLAREGSSANLRGS